MNVALFLGLSMGHGAGEAVAFAVTFNGEAVTFEGVPVTFTQGA